MHVYISFDPVWNIHVHVNDHASEAQDISSAKSEEGGWVPFDWVTAIACLLWISLIVA